MTISRKRRRAIKDNPLDGEQLLLDAMFGQKKSGSSPAQASQGHPPPAQKSPHPKPEHYKVVSISLYIEDIKRLEGMVKELKRRGHHKANKSQLIRQALAQVDLDRVANEA